MTAFLSVPDRRAQWRAAWRRHAPEIPLLEGSAALEARGPEVRWALVWRAPKGLWARLPGLELIFALGAGVDGMLADPELPAGVPIVRLRDAGMAAQMVDYCVYAALHFQRDFDRYVGDQGRGRWAPRPLRARMRVGVMGLGAMGDAVAQALRGLGFPVHGWTRRPRPSAVDMGMDVFAGEEGLEPFLSRTEVLVCLLPCTPNTQGLLDDDRLGQLPLGAALINVGRGALLDEGALVRALDRGHLRGAFLDVCAVEPLPPAHGLWRHPAVRLTPHVAATTLIEPAVEQVVANLRRWGRGEALIGRVDRGAGY